MISYTFVGWLRILWVVLPGILALCGASVAFIMAIWAGVEIAGRRGR